MFEVCSSMFHEKWSLWHAPAKKIMFRWLCLLKGSILEGRLLKDSVVTGLLLRGYLKRWKDTGSIDNLPGTGRPRKTSLHQDGVFRRISLTNHYLTSPDFLSEWSKKANFNVSSVTTWRMHRRLQNICLKRWRARRKPLLTKFQRMCRLAWAKEHQFSTVEQWWQVIFSDGSHLCLYENQARQYVQQLPHEELHPECVSVTEASNKSHGLGMHVSHWRLTASICGTVSSAKYITAL